MKPRAEQVKSKHKTQTKILNYILFFFVCAFIGWIWEIILTLIQTGNIVNRGVLHGPWLPIYGFGGVGILLLVGHLRKYPPLVFLTSAVFCGLMEYLTGWYLETVKHMKWWGLQPHVIQPPWPRLPPKRSLLRTLRAVCYLYYLSAFS